MKVYIVVFICFATKAIHIELAQNLSSEEFINCLKRFIARRGHVSNIYSDNATNFVGANREIKHLYNIVSQQLSDKLHDELSQRNIQWHFIPPKSPHFGGLWESAIKQVKYHITRLTANAYLTYIEMNTLVIQIEAIVNSRPIIPLSSDPNDMHYLSPAHFLIGDSLTTIVEPSIEHLKINTLSRWQRIEQMRQSFWRRWHKEYLHNLQCRQKWKIQDDVSAVKQGQLVLLKDDNLPPMKWTTGRIQELHPGDDGIVRAVTVKTKGGCFKRAVTKISPLPLE